MGVGAGLYMYDVVVILSPDEFLYYIIGDYVITIWVVITFNQSINQ